MRLFGRVRVGIAGPLVVSGGVVRLEGVFRAGGADRRTKRGMSRSPVFYRRRSIGPCRVGIGLKLKMELEWDK